MRIESATLSWERTLVRLVPGLPLVRLLASLIESGPEVVFAKDLEGRYLMINQAGADSLGLPREAILGRTDLDLFPAVVANRIRDWDRKAYESAEPIRYEGAAPLGPNERVYFTSKAALRDPQGRTVGLVGFSRDVTQVRRLEEDLRRLTQMTLDLLCVFGPDGCVRFVSDSFEKVLGWRREEVLGRRQRELVHEEDWPISREALRALVADRRPVIDFRNRVRCRNGDYLLVEWRCDPPDADGVVYAVGREVTDRARQEQQRDRAIDRAAERVEEAEAVAAQRARFVADLSHEIRTCLNAIVSAVQLAGLSSIDWNVREMLDVVGTASDALVVLLNDVLDLSKLEAAALDLDDASFPPAAPLREAVSLLRGRVLEFGVRLHVDVSGELPPLIQGDPYRLRQVLINLLDNAVKFAREEVQVSLAQEGGDLRFVVVDDGPGIDPERLQAIFSPYRQADAKVTVKHGGTGLGLAISRSLAELMGGALEVENREAGGAAFTLRLPVRVAEPVAVAVAEPVPDPVAETARDTFALPTGTLDVLIADDESLNQIVLRRMLESFGCQPRIVGDGAAALGGVAERLPDLVLLDVHMPVLDGLETARRILAERASSRRPHLVALTAAATDEVRRACSEAGFDECLIKPLRREDLARVIERAAARQAGYGVTPAAS